jgi:hypothetical protein
MVANVDPIQSILAEGFGYRAAADGPPRLIIVIGIWLIFLSLGGTALVALALSRGFNFLSILSFALLLVSAAILYRVTRNYIVKSRELRQTRDDA